MLTVRWRASKSLESFCCDPRPPLARRLRRGPPPGRWPPGVARPWAPCGRLPEGRRRRPPPDWGARFPSCGAPLRRGACPLPPVFELPLDGASPEEGAEPGRRRRERVATCSSPPPPEEGGRRRRPPGRRGRDLDSGLDIRLLDHELGTHGSDDRRANDRTEVPPDAIHASWCRPPGPDPRERTDSRRERALRLTSKVAMRTRGGVLPARMGPAALGPGGRSQPRRPYPASGGASIYLLGDLDRRRVLHSYSIGPVLAIPRSCRNVR